MKHEEKLYNSFRIAKSDILENQKMINYLNSQVIELTELFVVLQADHAVLARSLYERDSTAQSSRGKRHGLVNQHVVPRKDGWAVLAANAQKAAKVYPKKTQAVDHAKKLAKQGGVCAVIHNKDGTIIQNDCR